MARPRVRCILSLITPLSAMLVEACASGESPGSGSGSIVVQVVDVAGAPATSAKVTLFGFDRDWRYWKATGLSGHSDEPGRMRYDSLTVNDGASFVVRASAGDSSVGYHTCMLSDDSLHQDVRLQLEQA